MKNAQKEKLANNAVISIVLALCFAGLFYHEFNGLTNKIPTTPTEYFVNTTGILLILVGVIGAAFSHLRKMPSIFGFSITFAGIGVVMFLLKYGLISSPVPYGKYLFYSLMVLTGVYIIGAIVYIVRVAGK